MSKRASRGASGREPYLLFLVFAGVGLGIVLLDQPTRLALLWVTLVALSLFYRSAHRVEIIFSLPSLARGALLGLVISVPLLAFLSAQLRQFTEDLYATQDIGLLFYQICFVSAPVEEYFFRGVVQGQRGSSVGTALYAATALVYFLPHDPLAAVLALVAMGLLGMLYGYVRDRHGLAAAIACHVVVGFVLQVVPSLLAAFRAMLS